MVTLRRPERRNALSIELREEIADALPRLARTGHRRVVLTGAGTAFCSGMDVGSSEATGRTARPSWKSSVAAFDAVRRCATAAARGGQRARRWREDSRWRCSATCASARRPRPSGSRSSGAGSRRPTPPPGGAAGRGCARAVPDRPGRRRAHGAGAGDRQRGRRPDDLMPRALEIAGADRGPARAGPSSRPSADPARRREAWGHLFADEAGLPRGDARGARAGGRELGAAEVRRALARTPRRPRGSRPSARAPAGARLELELLVHALVEPGVQRDLRAA